MVDSKSTNISDILDEEDNNDLVQEIINEIQNQQQVQATGLELENVDTPVSNEQEQEDKEDTQNLAANNVIPTQSSNKDFASPIGVGVINPKSKNNKPEGFLDKLINFEKLKLALLVIGIVFLLSLPLIKKSVLKLIPNLSNNGELNFLGVFLKSLSAGILFYIGNIFI